MAVVDVEIGHRSFSLACEDGQEKHLRELAAQVGEKVNQLAEQIGTNNDTLLYVMSALMIQDELNDAAGSNDNTDDEVNIAVADAINAISDYVETVANRIERA